MKFVTSAEPRVKTPLPLAGEVEARSASGEGGARKNDVVSAAPPSCPCGHFLRCVPSGLPSGRPPVLYRGRAPSPQREKASESRGSAPGRISHAVRLFFVPSWLRGDLGSQRRTGPTQRFQVTLTAANTLRPGAGS
jgi:hypothetical protein